MSIRASRPLQLHHQDGEERKISWLELFYDLIYVTIIIQLGDFLSANVSPLGALLFVLLFVPVWWSWTGMMFYFNRFLVDDLWHRLLVFAQMFAIAYMAISVTGAFGPGDQAFALSYFAVRMILVILYLRTGQHVIDARPLIRRYAMGFAVAASLWAISAFVPAPYRYAIWVVALVLEFWVPLSSDSRRLQSLLPPDRPHLAERYGLFTIIVLGESFIKVVGALAGQVPTPATLTLMLLGFALAVSLWWLYFEMAGGPAEHATARASYTWIYLHLPITIAITAVGVGLKKIVVLDPGAPLPDQYRWLLAGAAGLFLLSVALLGLVVAQAGRRRLHTTVAVAASAAIVAVGAYGGALPAGIGLFLIVVACWTRILTKRLLPHRLAAPHTAPEGSG
ncbi:MAG: low temperature requirement protein A [Trueperaceae bacterium]